MITTLIKKYLLNKSSKTRRLNNRISIREIFDGNKKVGVFSKGILSIPYLHSFLNGEVKFNPKTTKVDYVVGWGMKESSRSAVDYSIKKKIPYVYLEDGFIRSVGLGVLGSPSLSLCVDNIGIYYDATKPSRLENILNDTGWEEKALLNDSSRAIDLILQYNLSKYNHAPINNDFLINEYGRDLVLLFDQTYGDMSISLGLATKNSFLKMYKEARKDNPNSTIIIKSHPDVINNKKKGHISKSDIDNNTVFIYEDINSLSLIEQVKKVYVVTSQAGFEALLLGKEVHCYGMPFYAGWGMTIDRIKLERRTKRRTVQEIFAAAYILYPRYICPETGDSGTIFDVIQYLINTKKNSENNGY
ncbi:capsular polysaccharide export protein, LipB/KpsS family [Rossellomorea vietnamensis]|uniref:capsular polysaccharide export protein, LipB/KpsS family n=1 Tax=Rossellomorea vietnamensis TaxID=218284 RepID=UPI00068FBC28|nr:beta-3-deoxy-D-manno-oct-2-ulosonic acid transferase [Rossellomorea vietnamensis]